MAVFHPVRFTPPLPAGAGGVLAALGLALAAGGARPWQVELLAPLLEPALATRAR